MGAPLYDITIYYTGQEMKGRPEEAVFQRTLNYIADFYHNSLNGYKPIKTARICINFGPVKNFDKPQYFGSICAYDSVLDELKYITLSEKNKFKYILDTLHSTVSDISGQLNWDQSVFDNAYNHIIESSFLFERFYPEKKSKDKKHIGQIILTKTVEKSTLSALVTDGVVSTKAILLEIRNWYWYDNNYDRAKNCKWLDNTSFGLCKDERNCYFSTESNSIVSDLVFGEKEH